MDVRPGVEKTTTTTAYIIVYNVYICARCACVFFYILILIVSLNNFRYFPLSTAVLHFSVQMNCERSMARHIQAAYKDTHALFLLHI